MVEQDFMDVYVNDPDELREKANELRKKYYGNFISFSKNIFVPVTRQCRNKCSYCGFVSDNPKTWIEHTEYLNLLTKAQELSCKEVLLTMGEKPELKYKSAKRILEDKGYSSTVFYVKQLCELALERKLLPHSNLGILDYEELKVLKKVNASMGLMLETTSKELLKKGKAHYNSPGKNPEQRLKTIKNAGKLKIPFTTGILIGIGETLKDRIESLQVIANLAKKYNHIQEVIIQNFNPICGTEFENKKGVTDNEYLLVVSLGRLILPPNVSLQIPPNLNTHRLLAAIEHGSNDLGGISPLTKDHINPTEVWPKEKALMCILRKKNLELKERLPVYPRMEKYLPRRIKKIIKDVGDID